jgi:hypothetical protein
LRRRCQEAGFLSMNSFGVLIENVKCKIEKMSGSRFSVNEWLDDN